MHSIELAINNSIMDRFPTVKVGGFIASNLESVNLDRLESAIGFAGVTEALVQTFPSPEALLGDARIAGWRKAIGMCGLKPSTYRGSVEQLARRVLKGAPARTGVGLVDAYCAVSIKHLAPMGAYDLDRLPTDRVELRLPAPVDHFEPLGSRADEMPLSKDVAVYASGDAIVCYAFNHRDSSETCLASTTRSALFISEAVEPSQHAALSGALAELWQALQEAGGRVGGIVVADVSRPRLRARPPHPPLPVDS